MVTWALVGVQTFGGGLPLQGIVEGTEKVTYKIKMRLGFFIHYKIN